MSKATILPPDFDDVLADLKREIFAQMNCVQIGKVESYNTAEQTVEIQLQLRRRVDDTRTVAYPLLVDCPVFVLQGGGAYIDMPIAPGDFCIVLFNDRDIDNWWDAAQDTAPRTRRKHSLSDGIALVGLNPKPNVLDLDGADVRIMNDGGNVKIEAGTDVDVDATNVNLNGDSKRFVTYTELNTALQTFMTALNLHVHTSAPAGSPTTPPVASMSLDISTSETQTVRTGG